MKNKVVVFWFRRDLRIEDNVGLHEALNSGYPVIPMFVFDPSILNELEDKSDRRVDYIQQALTHINKSLEKYNSTLFTYYAKPLDVFKELSNTFDVHSVYVNRDYEPQAIQRDLDVEAFLKNKDIGFLDFKDQVVFEKSEIVKKDGKPYTIYTPYSKVWKANLKQSDYEQLVSNYNNFYKTDSRLIHSLESIGFQKTDIDFETPRLNQEIICDYDKYRDYPAMDHTTHLGIALRFGTISIRKCVAYALDHNNTWLSELIWREFFMQILYHFPKVVKSSFKPAYDGINYRDDEAQFELWCQGKTGYPIVDAGMRQLNETGFMHNRVRMIVASFLCKHLLIDWRWGEAYFAKKLNDYDLSANNGNWQWAAGSGCDAAPYFRIFNPTAQTLKFDKALEYIKTWNPDYEQRIEAPIVEHVFARERVLKAYSDALKRD